MSNGHPEQDPAEGSRKTIERELWRETEIENHRAHGPQRLQSRPEIKERPLTESYDRGDEPKKPYGLTETVEDQEPGDRSEKASPPK